jgi:HlyD family secretion protein
MTALAVSALFLVGFGTWASNAPIAGAVMVSGAIVASGHNQKIQHLEGGIIRTLFVKEGDRVTKGEPLVAFDPTAAEAQRDALLKKLIALRSRAARLTAERDGLQELRVTPELRQAAAEQGNLGLIDEQQHEFAARLERYRQERSIMGQRISALQDQIGGVEVQRQALARELEVVREEMTRKRGLLDKGLAARDEYTQLLRSEAELVGQQGQMTASMLAAKTQVSEVQQQIERLETQRVETAASQFNDLRTSISETAEQLRSAEDVVYRLVVRAPSDGTVVKMNVNVGGSVLQAGDTVLELLPTGEPLLVEARVAPTDIDEVSVGQSARLRFTALNARRTPTIDAKVTYISADSVVGQDRKSYYLARLPIADELPPELQREQIYPGMPVEVYITTQGRTLAEYLVKPIIDSFNKAFRQD